MTNPLPARAHANASVAERELTFDALLAEFEHEVEVEQQREHEPEAVDAAEREPEAEAEHVTAAAAEAPRAEGLLAAEAKPERRPKSAARQLSLPSTPVMQSIGLGLLFVASLTLVIVALSR